MNGDAPHVDDQAAEARIDLLSRSLGLFGLMLIFATQPLWRGERSFPVLPRWSALEDWAVTASTPVSLTLELGFLALLVMPSSRRFGVGRVIASAVVGSTLAASMLLDECRLQPWSYQFLIFAWLLLIAPERSVLRWGRWFVVGIYVWAGLAKLDQPFLTTHGQTLLSGALSFFDVEAKTLPETLRLALASTMPIGEIAVGVLLALPKTRTFGVWLAAGLHIALLGLLGPWGMDQQPGVLLWNGFFLVQNAILFGRWSPEVAESPGDPQPEPSRLRGGLLLGTMLPLFVLPALEPFGYWEVWPSWAVYAAHPSRVDIYVENGAEDDLPEEWRRFFIPAGRFRDRDWLVVKMHDWSLETLHAPLPPGERVPLKIAGELRSRLASGSVAVRVRGPAHRLTGIRTTRWIVD